MRRWVDRAVVCCIDRGVIGCINRGVRGCVEIPLMPGCPIPPDPYPGLDTVQCEAAT